MIRRSALLLATVLLFAACETDTATPEIGDDTAADTAAAESSAIAVATLEPTEGNQARGTVTFTSVDNGVRVNANITGLAEGPHGIHVHEFGDCSAPDASSAGGHFAPAGSPHGAPDASSGERHVGDLGNLEADAEGTASYELTDEVITLEGPNSIVGKAVVVHAGEDDLSSQPSGDSGARVACGVITMQDVTTETEADADTTM